MGSILLVAPDFRSLEIRQQLEDINLQVDVTNSTTKAKYLLNREQFDIVVIDVSSPAIDGWVLLRHVRSISEALVLMMVEDGNNEILLGLSLGADDCVPQSTSVRVLTARIRALLRRTGTDILV